MAENNRRRDSYLRYLKEKISKQKVGTKEFAQAVGARLGQKPTTLPAVSYTAIKHVQHKGQSRRSGGVKKELVGTDVFIQWTSSLKELVKSLLSFNIPISNYNSSIIGEFRFGRAPIRKHCAPIAGGAVSSEKRKNICFQIMS